MVVFMLGVSGAVKKYEQNPMSATIKYLHVKWWSLAGNFSCK